MHLIVIITYKEESIMLNVSKGDTVILKGFTGIKLGVFEVAKATEKSITIKKKDGSLMIFSKKDGRQTNVEEGKEKYANSVMENDGSYVKPNSGGRKKKAAKPAKKPEPVEEVEDDEDEFEDDDDDFEELD
jgi:hypothetical protein